MTTTPKCEKQKPLAPTGNMQTNFHCTIKVAETLVSAAIWDAGSPSLVYNSWALQQHLSLQIPTIPLSYEDCSQGAFFLILEAQVDVCRLQLSL